MTGTKFDAMQVGNPVRIRLPTELSAGEDGGVRADRIAGKEAPREMFLLRKDWGCIAVTDEEVEEIWRSVPNGAVVEIRP